MPQGLFEREHDAAQGDGDGAAGVWPREVEEVPPGVLVDDRPRRLADRINELLQGRDMDLLGPVLPLTCTYGDAYTPCRGVRVGPAKAALNLAKHGVHFADATVALEDKDALTMRDPGFHDEERFIALALDPTGTVLVVVYPWRGERLRLISARRATRRERRQYEEGA